MLMARLPRQVAARPAVFHLKPKRMDLRPRLKQTLSVLKRAVTVAITKEGSIYQTSPPRLLITPEALCLHF